MSSPEQPTPGRPGLVEVVKDNAEEIKVGVTKSESELATTIAAGGILHTLRDIESEGVDPATSQ